MKKILDGNTACSNMAYLFSEVCTIYPITPASPMASNIDKLINVNTKNLYNEEVKLLEMQSEAGAAGAMHGALMTGSLTTTFTSSQGLLLMLPNMYKMAGEMLPGVIHVAARSIATHALSIFGDHSDIYQARTTGFCMLASTNVRDCSYLAIVAHLSSIASSMPFLHFFDGFRTSHELNVVDELDKEDLLKLVDYDSLKKFKNKSLHIDNNISRGLAENEDIYFQSLEAKNQDYLKVADTVNYYMQAINKLANTNYQPFNYYGNPYATDIIIAMGSVVDTIKLVVDQENKNGKKIGVVEVHLYRPFSKEYLTKVIPSTVKNIAVLDRTKEAGSVGEPLYLDVLATLGNKYNIVGGRFGLASKNTTPKDILAVYNMLQSNLQNNFTIGINDDVTNLSLKEVDYKIDLDCEALKIYGYGSDGMVSASKDILKIVGIDKYINGYFEYDSKKSGGVTISHLRFGSSMINAPYYVENPHLIVVTKLNYFEKFKIINDIKSNGILLVNAKELILPDEVVDIIKKKNICVYQIDAEGLANKYHLNGKISKIMEACILHLLNISNGLDILQDNLKVTFKSKGQDVVDNNLKAVDETISNLQKVDVKYMNKHIKENTNIYEKILHREGYELAVSELEKFKDGTFPGGLTKEEKRNIANVVPKWIKENCILCGMCSIVCPHAVIRPFATKDKTEGINFLGNNEYNYVISVSEEDCTSCGLCIKACPGKGGIKALEFGNFDKNKALASKKYFDNYQNPDILDKFTIKGSQLQKPKMEFSGACSGCGQTAYLKLLTQLYGDNLIIANATGCSSIYGGSAPSTAYSIPWANSLFEDNAEFGYGMYLALNQKRQHLKNIVERNIANYSVELKELFNKWLDNFNDYKITKEIKEEVTKLEVPSAIKDLLEYIPSHNVWAIGGDGWAYDIGFGGLDHVLYSNENIKILVLDTEVYSNTGGQSSKASHISQVAEFANLGKRTYKKDLFKYAMTIPNCYVASINLGANPFQTIKAFKEANNHKGPAIIIAYATCIEHGIKNGMSCSLEESKLAVEVGYSLLMRYNPLDNKLSIDSKEPNFTKYEEFLDNEVRYHSLKIKNASLANELMKLQKENAIKRYQYYVNLSE